MIIVPRLDAPGADGSSRARPSNSGGDQVSGALPADRITLPPPLTVEQLRLVTSLQERDRQVHAHEAAHQAAGGSLAGAASFDYEQGPDGKSYAIGGEVSISVGGGRTPQQRVDQARAVRAAALAPSDPSGQDLRVAAEASAVEAQATAQLSEQLRLALRGTHVHGAEPCASCAKAAASFSSSS